MGEPNDMKKLNKEEQAKVESAKKAIHKLQEVEGMIYENLVNEIGINDCSPIILDDDWLYDYIYNCIDETDDYTKMVREKIFN